MPPLWNGGHPDYDTERDFVGYGEAGLNPKWPNNAKIAISFVINYEEVLCPILILSFPVKILHIIHPPITPQIATLLQHAADQQ
jgi:hypothetical protein